MSEAEGGVETFVGEARGFACVDDLCGQEFEVTLQVEHALFLGGKCGLCGRGELGEAQRMGDRGGDDGDRNVPQARERHSLWYNARSMLTLERIVTGHWSVVTASQSPNLHVENAFQRRLGSY